MSCPREALPLAPLLHAHVAAGLPSPGVLHQLPGLGPRFSAILGATARFLYTDFLDRAPDEQLREALVRFFREHPLVSSVSPASDREGGGGATIVELKE